MLHGEILHFAARYSLSKLEVVFTVQAVQFLQSCLSANKLLPVLELTAEGDVPVSGNQSQFYILLPSSQVLGNSLL